MITSRIGIALIHGDETNLLNEVVRSQHYDLVVSGHAHSVSILQAGRTISLNPGEVCGHLSGKEATIATFETMTRKFEILDI